MSAAASVVQAEATSSALLNPLNFLFKPGLAGGQAAAGGINVGDSLDLEGNNNVAEAGGEINLDAHVEFNYSEGNTTPAVQSSARWNPTFVTAGVYIGGFLATLPDITYTNAFYIYSTVQDNSIHRSNAAAGFQAFTLFNALCSIFNGTSNASVQMIILNDGGTHARLTAGTSTALQHLTVSAVPQLAARAAGATMTWTNGACGLQFSPKWDTDTATSVVNMNDLVAVDVVQPGPALFQQSNGTENIALLAGLVFPTITLSSPTAAVAVRSSLLAGTGRFLIEQLGTAPSDFGASPILFDDLFGPRFGNGTDAQEGWAGAGFWFLQFNALADQLQISNPSADRILFDQAAAIHEFNWNCDRFSWGAQTGTVGNQVGVFVTPAGRLVPIPGGWSDFLLTQGGNVDLNGNAMSQVFGWTINAPNITLSAGSVTDAGAMLIGGNVDQGTNRYGLLILSAPTGGTINEALRVLTGRARFSGDFFHDGTNFGVYGTAPIAQQLAVPVTIAAVHAALVALGFIT